MSAIQFCPGCNILFTNLLFYKFTVPIYKCDSCGLGAAFPKGFNAETYYDESYFNGSKSDGYSDYLSAANVLREQFKSELCLLSKFGSKGGNLLELGCAYGYFLDIARDKYTVHGLELCEHAVNHCHAKGLFTVKRGVISEVSIETMPMFDVVVMLDVIEHLENPSATLSIIENKLNADGLVLITTGDFSSLCAKLTGKRWRLMTPPQHLWFFTPLSLEKIANLHNLEVVHIDHPFKKVPFGLIIYQLCRYFSFKPKLPSWMHKLGLPVNLFDAMRIVLRKRIS